MAVPSKSFVRPHILARDSLFAPNLELCRRENDHQALRQVNYPFGFAHNCRPIPKVYIALTAAERKLYMNLSGVDIFSIY
jgi:hypothetical protein